MDLCASADAWFGLAGVAVGFILGELSGVVRRKLEISRRRKLIVSELKSILSQLPQKLDLLTKARDALKRKEVLPLMSVRILTAGYESVLADLYPHLTDLQRNCLHVIYERVRVAEEFMASFEASFLSALERDGLENARNVYSGLIEDIRNSYKVVEDLAKSYLADNPIDVFYVAKGAD
jgi:hypothetical protein